MKTKLAELAGAMTLRGAVCVTDAQGVTHRYDDEAAAEEVWGAKAGSLSHRRGGFVEAPGTVVVGGMDDVPDDDSSSGGKRRKRNQ